MEHCENKKSNKSVWRQILAFFCVAIRQTYDWICDLIFHLIYQNVEIKKLPAVSDPLLLESAASLAEKIRNKEITSEKVVQAFIQRIKEVNHIINAIVEDRFDRALKEAKAADDILQSGSISRDELKFTKPLFGVPFTSKESSAAEGMLFSCGLYSRKGKRASENAYIVERLQEAGAILIGVSNVPELNLWVETRNPVYGQTQNPYNTNRIVGGSSGGESCIVSSCGSPIGLGTDIGGSARVPAYFCGVYGHKLTTGLIDLDGIIFGGRSYFEGLISTRGMSFRTGEEGRTMVAAGAITRYAEDVEPVSVALVKPEKLHLLKLDTEVDAKNLNYYYVVEPGDPKISPICSELKDAMFRVVRLIKEDKGFQNSPKEVYYSGFRYSYTLWRYWMSKEPFDFPLQLGNLEKPVNVFIETPKKLMGKSNHSLAAILKLIDLHLPLPSSTWAENETEKLLNQILATIGENGVLLFPSYPSTAPFHCEPFLRPYNFGYWAIFNVLNLPVTQIPLGLGRDGLPIGIQVVAGPNQDKLCFAVCKYIEKLAGGWVPPFSGVKK